LQVKDRLKNNIEPSVMGLFDVAVEKIENQNVIKIILAAGPEKPYYVKKFGMTAKGCFIRVGSASEPMNQDTIEALFSTRVRNSIGRMPSPRQNLTFEQLKIYYLERGLKLNDAFMHNLELLTAEGKPNYAAYLLADDNGVSVQIAKYTDTTRVHLMENRDFGRCSLVKAYKQVMERMDVENTIFTKIAVPYRLEKELLNSIAIREAVVNAIVHNNYSNGSCPKFEFFSDRLEITSAGGLPYGLRKEDFFDGHSAPRNKEIMRVFRDLEIVEQLGSGIPRIIDAYGKECIQLSNNFFRLVFPYAEGLIKTPDDLRQMEYEGVNTPQVAPQVTPQVTPQVKKLLKNLSGEMMREELQALMELKDRKSFSELYLKPALEAGLIEMTIPDKPNSRLQKYRLTEKGVAAIADFDLAQSKGEE